MKIECDKCGAKYSIADEKVRGKTFKIRCKKCSNVIIVRDKVAAVAASGGGGHAAHVEQPAAHPGWHLAINGETVGPMSEVEVRQRYEALEIDKDTAIWQEGFEDWVPLGDVPSFADLPERAPAGDDPFASANQDDYAAAAAASAAAGGAAMVAGGGGYGAHDDMGGSPRVSSLTGQRNENSVLFSLDSLQALATGGGAAAAAPMGRAAAPGGGGGGGPIGNARTGTKGLATVAPSSEGSGLIDIRALGAMVGGGEQPSVAASPSGAAGADDAAMPSFGGAGIGGLASTPLVPQAAHMDHAAAAAMAAPPARSNAPLYLLMGILVVCVVFLGGYVLLREPDQVIVDRTPQDNAPSVKGGAADDEDKDKDDEDEDKDKDKDKDKDDEGEGEDEGEDKGEGGGGAVGVVGKSSSGGSKGKRGKRSGGGRRSSGGGSKPSGDPFGGSSKSPPPTPKDSGSKSSGGGSDLDVDCILTPNLPKCRKGGKKPSGGSKGAGGGSSDPNLPEKLASADIKAGVGPLKGQAKSCGRKHNAKPGTKVKVKLSIAGKSGTVISARAQAPHQGTPLGNCVAAVLKRAKFKKFRKSSIGAVYPVTM